MVIWLASCCIRIADLHLFNYDLHPLLEQLCTQSTPWKFPRFQELKTAFITFYYQISREKFEPELGFETWASGFLARCSTI